jgi:hypothetical protein
VLNQESLRNAVECLRVALDEYPGTIRWTPLVNI